MQLHAARRLRAAAGPSRHVQRRVPLAGSAPSQFLELPAAYASRGERCPKTITSSRRSARPAQRADGDFQRDGAGLQVAVRAGTNFGADTLVRSRRGHVHPRRHAHASRAQPGQARRAPATARHPHVLSVRDCPEFCEPVEQVTGRTVRSFHSNVDGMAVETFILYPADHRGASKNPPESQERTARRGCFHTEEDDRALSDGLRRLQSMPR
jgi:hypothetical protein